jgi:hypothetical protein
MKENLTQCPIIETCCNISTLIKRIFQRVGIFQLHLAYYSRVLKFCAAAAFFINPLKPTGFVMHQQVNIQQLHILLTLYLCENKQRLVPLTA